MLMKIRCVSNENQPGVTVDQVYTVLGITDSKFVILNDDNELIITVHSVDTAVRWVVESVTDIGPVQIFPET